MSVIKKISKDKWMYIAAFFVPWLLIIAHSLIRDGWPFGNGSIFLGDSGCQLYQLCVELWNKVHSGQSLFYSWNAGDGVDFYLNFSYYLVSPFSLVILAVPKNMLINTVQIVMILKWSCIYMSMVYFFMHTRINMIKTHRGAVSFLLGGIVALSNCMLINIAYFNWNDVIILFPLLLLMLEEMIETGKWKGYYILLSIAMICNFYMAYQVCIFLIIWFFFLMSKETEEKLKKIAVFAGSSLLAASSSLVIILPAVLSGFDRQVDGIESEHLNVHSYVCSVLVKLDEFFLKFFIFDDITDVYSYSPNIFFSVGAVILVMLYLNVRSKYKRKLMYISIFLILSIFLGILNYVWHGFSIPHGIYNRFLYMLIFVFACMLMDVFQHFNEIKTLSMIVVGVLSILIFIVTFFSISDYRGYYVYLTTIMLIVLYNILLVLYIKHSISINKMLAFFSVVIFIELMVNAEYQLKEYNMNPIMKMYNMDEACDLLSNVSMDKGERMDIINGLRNEGMLFNMMGDGIFLSYCNGKNVRFHKLLGMGFENEAIYDTFGASPVLNCVLNLRYGIGDNDIAFSDSDVIESKGVNKLYRRSHILGLGYMADKDLEKWTVSDTNPFEMQEKFVSLSSGEEGVFETIYTSPICVVDGEYALEGEVSDDGRYTYRYTAKSENGEENTMLQFEIDRDMDLYIFSYFGFPACSAVYINENNIYMETRYKYQQTFHVGKVKKGDIISLYSFHDINAGDENEIYYYFSEYDDDGFENFYDTISQHLYEIEEMNSSNVKGHIYADKDGIMMTSIQASDGFSVEVDGKACEYVEIGDTFIGVPLKKGNHEVCFSYITPHFKEGMIGSLTGILIFIMICVFDKIKSNKGYSE